MSSYFTNSERCIARIRAEGPAAVRERRITANAEAERSSSNRPVHGQHLGVLHFIKECLPKFFDASIGPIELRVVTEGTVVEQCDDGTERLYQDCVLEAMTGGLEESDLSRLRCLTRSIVWQLAADPQPEGSAFDDPAKGFVRQRLGDAFSPETDSADDALLALLGRAIARSFSLNVPGLNDLQMSGMFVSAPVSAAPVKEQVFKGRIGGGSFLGKDKRELLLLVDAPAGAKKKHERVSIEYNPPQHKLLVYPLLLEPEQIVYLRVKSSRVRRENGTTSSPFQLVAVLTREEAEDSCACESSEFAIAQ